MSESTNLNINPGQDEKTDVSDSNIAASSEVSSIAGSVKHRHAISSERQIKFERAQKCLENAALVSKRIKEHRKATAELLGRPFEDDDGDTASEMGTTMSEKTSYSVTTDTSTTLSVQDALNIPGISESLANTLKQKEILMERIKQYKEISKRPMKKVVTTTTRRDSISEAVDNKKASDNLDLTKLTSTIKEKDNALSIMQVKIKAMETTILDLQEKINEKDQLIEAKNKATTLMSDTLNRKEKDSMDVLDETKQQMINMQNNFIAMETDWKQEKQKLLQDINEKNQKIKSLEEANTILENSRFEISIAHSKTAEELDLKTKEVNELQDKIKTLEDASTSKLVGESKENKESHDTDEIQKLTKKIELLEQLNFELRQTNKELENNIVSNTLDIKTVTSPSKKGSPLPTRKGGRNTASKAKSPWTHLSPESSVQEPDKKGKSDKAKSDLIIQSLNKEILQKDYVIAEKEACISKLQSENNKKEKAISELQLLMNTKNNKVEMIDIGITVSIPESQNENIDNETPITVNELADKLKLAQDQILSLNGEIDVANKNMIKVKSNFKLKVKQMQKTIENFSKVSDTNAEIVKLNEEIHQLTQKVAELEEEKGNLQLHLVDYDSGRLTETEVYKKLVEIENLAEARLKSIGLLETQKFDLVQELHSLQQKNLEMEDKLADISVLQNEQVCSEMKFVQLEEQIDELQASKKEFELIIDNLKLDKEQLNGNIQILKDEKEELTQKLENYVQENIELTDKLDKLSAEKVSSAESIEIVESLTTQEKLELEEYNKCLLTENKGEKSDAYNSQAEEKKDNIEDTVELKKKIELFTYEREEVMEKMNKLTVENESLNENIRELKDQCNSLKYTINILEDEKNKLLSLNDEINHQLEDLKHERSEILREAAESVKPSSIEDVIDGSVTETVIQDDKTAGDKTASRVKSVKQLTKEILKLKNVIKEREDEIADCQMKILSLEEQEEKHKDISQNFASHDKVIKKLTDENNHLKKQIETINNENKAEQSLQLTQTHEILQSEIQKVHQEYTTALNARDARILELENLLVEYEKQVINYSNTLQQKDKEISEYLNQITKLNDLTKKLKSTIDLFEEEKAKDQNSELIKSLNKQTSLYQKTLSDYEEKLRALEEDKVQFHNVKTKLENKNSNLEAELKKLQELITEKQNLIKESQIQQQKQTEELSAIILQAKERDEEIHEIKLQLRKESIENEKLHNIVVQKSNEINDLTRQYENAKEKLSSVSFNQNTQHEQFTTLENKNKELMEKLKKFAVNIKKKTAMYTELENQYFETQKQLENKNEQHEQLLIQVETIPALQEKLKHAEEEFNRLQSLKIVIEQKSEEILQLKSQIETLNKNNANDVETITKLNESIDLLNKDLYFTREENINLKAQMESLSHKHVEYEIEQKNSANLLTKISCLEADINQKQMQITDLTTQVEIQNEKLMQTQFGHDAKVQERDMYIESLQSEIDRYIKRINRLEDSISTMENRRQSLERKADDLDTQLNEKQKAYNEYTDQEDELVTRLAVLIDNDRVVEKQLKEIESENKELRFKIQHINEEFSNLKEMYSELQNKCEVLEVKAAKLDFCENEMSTYQSNIHELDNNLKRLSQDHNVVLAQKKKEIEDLETEFNSQIENTLKEKKFLCEKYEKICDHVSELEFKLNEYKNTIESLNLNINELAQENQRLLETPTRKEKQDSPDYTEQYISEINNLNSILNSKNQEIIELGNKLHNLQTNNLSNLSMLENKSSNLSTKLDESYVQINNLMKEIDILKKNNEQLQLLVTQKDEQIKQMMENKKVIFEMNIPKTEGMTISSTIEAVDNEPLMDISSLQSQIISDEESSINDVKSISKKVSGNMQKQPSQSSRGLSESEGVVEESIVPKKTYLCYKEEEMKEEIDPFNSDEGWGLETTEESDVIIPGSLHLNQKIQELKDANDKLKSELDITNAKFHKVLKKLKDLKVVNETLSNELQLSRKISQSSMLDMAIESELSNNVQELEKKVQDIEAELNKEKREKEGLRKQNEVIKNANDKLLEMKEKMDNEIQLWKYNFKQANDKISSLQWGGESKDATDGVSSQTTSRHRNIDKNDEREEISKLERENDELQAMIDNMNIQNKEILSQRNQLEGEINELKLKLQQHATCDNCQNKETHYNELSKQNELLQIEIVSLKELLDKKVSCENCELLKKQLEESQSKYISLEENTNLLSSNLRQLEIRCNDLSSQNENLQQNLEENLNLKKQIENEYLDKNNKLIEEIQSLKHLENEANQRITFLNSELEEIKSKFTQSHENKNDQTINDAESLVLAEKYNTLEEHTLNLKNSLDNANIKILELEKANKELTEKSDNYINQISDLNAKLQNLNAENDQLLSTVTELRSSVASAMDQRGFEIAELWKQHLAQRESEFQQLEHDLRTELSAAEAKYEQLFENVQSSSQEETNKIIMSEQISSLQNKLQEKEEQLVNLQLKYEEVIGQLDILRFEIEDEKVIHENKLLVNQEEYEKVIKDLTKSIEEFKQNNQAQCDDYQTALLNLQTELDATKSVNLSVNQQVEEVRNNYEHKVADLSRQLQIKESEIFQKAHDFTITLTQRNEEFENVRKQLIDYEKKVEDLSYEKESELAILRLKMHEQTENFDKIQKEIENERQSIAESLKEKIIECINLNKQITDLNRVLEEYANRATETQTVLESQELEIVTLKDEILSLENALRSASSKIEKHVTFASSTKQGIEADSTSSGMDKELLDAVPRAELDLALYMLHQRDVRCEELTMELTQLLDERDTLQLRLSDSLRSFEELKSRCNTAGLDISISSSQDGSTEMPTLSIGKESQYVDTHKVQPSRSSSISEPDAEKPKLQAKLSELRSVKQSRDVRLRHESEQRQLGMRLLQRDVANLPPEAVEQLAQAHHTLSRDTQSTPTVLLNWLRGKSTPKVVHM